MAGKAPVKASDEQRAGLEVLALSRNRGEADRARALLLTLDGWTSARIAEVFRVREDTVRFLARRFHARGRRGPQGERVCRPAASEDRGRAAGLRAVARSAGREPCELDHPAPHRRDQKARTRRYRAIATLQGAAKKNFRWRRPRRTLKGRQIAAEIERVGLRPPLRKAQRGR